MNEGSEDSGPTSAQDLGKEIRIITGTVAIASTNTITMTTTTTTTATMTMTDHLELEDTSCIFEA